ncbi:hypothetical protein [Ruminococcus albus]|uniref:DUF4358 domain-containing protein n=1 Tax=Ruminococcus albus TaxID=1264 RepID=A0A1H7FPQ1_RUMAL|nr:hypothetical protein [Ruminococcus albus]SEK26130.1 hypothetical protein SAMN05216469_101298 [Ruminococcus albus]
MCKKIIALALLGVMLLSSCGISAKTPDSTSSETVTSSETTSEEDTQSTVDTALLREKYPEYFELSNFKGIEVYVWQMSQDSYLCGLMSGTNRNKTDEEIAALSEKALEIDEAKAILDYLGVTGTDIIVIPVIQPYSSYLYEIDEAYTEKVRKLFE